MTDQKLYLKTDPVNQFFTKATISVSTVLEILIIQFKFNQSSREYFLLLLSMQYKLRTSCTIL